MEGGVGYHPATTIDPVAESILELFKRLGNKNQCAASMRNAEQFMSSSDLVSLDNKQIESICAVNCRIKRHSKT